MTATPIPAITPLPTAPARTMPQGTFGPVADAFLSALQTFSTQLTTWAQAVFANAQATATDATNTAGSASSAATSASAAAASAMAVAISAAVQSTSTSSVTVGTGQQTFGVATGKLFQPGQQVMAASTASPQKFMLGQVASYNSSTGALVLNVTQVGGSGTFAAWTIGVVPTNYDPDTTNYGDDWFNEGSS